MAKRHLALITQQICLSSGCGNLYLVETNKETFHTKFIFESVNLMNVEPKIKNLTCVHVQLIKYPFFEVEHLV